jgi:hypothetical protein
MPERDPIDSQSADRTEWKITYMKPYVEPQEIRESRLQKPKESLSFAVMSLKKIWHDIIDPHRKK